MKSWGPALFTTMLFQVTRGFQHLLLPTIAGKNNNARQPLRIMPTRLHAKRRKTTTVRKGDFWEASMDGWRPTVNDVERISWGKPAKEKGTGSRGVPHRLNEEERFLFDQARRKGFLEIPGSGWRSQRREAPLLNTYRSLCDARGQASIVLHKKAGNGEINDDELVVDLSPLRNPNSFPDIAQFCLERFNGGELIFQENDAEEDEELSTTLVDESEDNRAWETRPIYQLPPYCVKWELSRSEAKTVGKNLAEMFDTAEGKTKVSKKPVGVMPGKSRRHGGYGIG